MVGWYLGGLGLIGQVVRKIKHVWFFPRPAKIWSHTHWIGDKPQEAPGDRRWSWNLSLVNLSELQSLILYRPPAAAGDLFLNLGSELSINLEQRFSSDAPILIFLERGKPQEAASHKRPPAIKSKIKINVRPRSPAASVTSTAGNRRRPQDAAGNPRAGEDLFWRAGNSSCDLC